MIKDIKIAIKMIKEQPEEYQRWFNPFYPTMHYVNPYVRTKKYDDSYKYIPQPWVGWVDFFNKIGVSYIICKCFNKTKK